MKTLILIILISFSLNLLGQNIFDSLQSKDKNIDSLTGSIISKHIAKSNNIREDVINRILLYGQTFLGLKYKYTGISPLTGFDCSGFIYHIHRHFKLDMPRVSDASCLLGIKVSIDSLEPGDLVYFKTRNARSNAIGHVAIVVKKTQNSFIMLHSVNTTGVTLEEYGKMSYYVKRLLFAVRLPDEFYFNAEEDIK